MKNIHVLPTDKPSRLYYSGNNADLILSKELISFKTFERSPQDFYITSNEEIKMDDWYLDDTNSVRQAITECESYWTHRKKYQKIILTTNQDLIKDGVQAIDYEFLEWFVKNPSCEEVELKKGFADGTAWGYNFLDYKIIIPKEEPKQENCCTPLGQIKRYEDCYGCDRKPKQEKLTYTESAKKEERISNCTMMKRKQKTVEERELYWDLVDAKAEQNNTIDLDAYAKGVQDGVKWMQERMYSEEDMISFAHFYFREEFNSTMQNSDKSIDEILQEWFNQFKKK